MGRKHPKETYKQANIELLREKLKESKYTGKDVSVILGYASSWFDNMLMRNTTVSEFDMNKMAMLLGFDPADAYITEEPQKEMPAEKKDEATSNDEIVAVTIKGRVQNSALPNGDMKGLMMGKRFEKSRSICWTCMNAVPEDPYGCSWSRDLTPVEGWTALEPRSGVKGSYMVIECPKYTEENYDSGKQQP